MIRHLDSWQYQTVLRTGSISTLHPSQGRAGALRCTSIRFSDITKFRCTWVHSGIGGTHGAFETQKRTKRHQMRRPRSASQSFLRRPKLTKTKSASGHRICASRGGRCTSDEWIRDVILARVAVRSLATILLCAEILGVRLLLVNVLRPLAAGQKLAPEAFDKLLDEISTAKHELAGKLRCRRKEIMRWQRQLGDAKRRSSGRSHMPIYTYGVALRRRF